MTDKQQFILAHRAARMGAIQAVQDAPDGYLVEIKPPTRNLAMNSLLWACLSEVSKQVEWYGKHLTPENWKDIFTAALKRTEVVPGLDGGFVVLGQRTSQMSKRLFSDLLELIFSFGAELGIDFKTQAPEEYQAWVDR